MRIRRSWTGFLKPCLTGCRKERKFPSRPGSGWRTDTGALTYNGDIRSAGQLRDLLRRFPMVTRVMIGRGLIADPALIRELRGGPRLGVKELHRFHDEVLDGRMEELKDFKNVAGKMKELWFYMGPGFREAGRQLKSIKKARTYDEYRAATDWLFSSCSLSEDDNCNSFFLEQ